MSVNMIDSKIFGNAWGTDEMRDLFDEIPRTQAWLDIISVLAESQADVGLIPLEAVDEIRELCNVNKLDLKSLRLQYDSSGHSMYGLIQELKKLSSGIAGEWIYYGATVQDITDTWMSIVLKKVWKIVFRDLSQIENDLLVLAIQHRDTPMLGRTHGQPGLPITFGFKVAIWTREIRRHIERLKDVNKRIGEGQLAGGVGSLAAFGEKGLTLQSIFFKKLGLRSPDIAWISVRDNQTEFIQLLSMISSTFDKIGHEVYTLQRPEIGEVSERFIKGAVSSITMPQKRNPEIAEHLGTLARLIRHNTNCLNENLAHENERDGRSWKSEWFLISTICVMMGALLSLGRQFCSTLQVNNGKMMDNLEAAKGQILAEGVMLSLAKKIGKQSAHDLVYKVSMKSHEENKSFKASLIKNKKVMEHFSLEKIDKLLDYKNQLGLCPEFVDRVEVLTQESMKFDRKFIERLNSNK